LGIVSEKRKVILDFGIGDLKFQNFPIALFPILYLLLK